MPRKKCCFDRDTLKSKPLLTIAESRFYIGVSRHTFESLEAYDTTFPLRKTPTMHSRALLDEWLARNGSLYSQNPHHKSLGKHAAQFALALEQLN